ncbi:glycosyltransferase [bacterium RCC_150]
MTSTWTVAHDFAFHFGGAERVTAQLQAAVGTEPLRVLAGSDEVIRRMGMANQHIRLSPSWVNEANYRPLALVHALTASHTAAVEGNLLASSYGFSQMLGSKGLKVVYCHSPLRQAWSGIREYSKAMGPLIGSAWRYGAAPVIRGLDRRATRSTDHFIATSRAVQDRILLYYGRESIIIPPPVDEVFTPSFVSHSAGRNYVWAGRIVEPYKKLGMLVEAFAQSPERTLTVVGDGRDRLEIESKAPGNVQFIGEVDSEALAEIYQTASAVIMPSEDDFGMVATEAIATGTPVIAFKAGGALDTVRHGRSGILYSESSPKGIISGLREFESHSWDRREVAKCGEKYTARVFRRTIKDFLSEIA